MGKARNTVEMKQDKTGRTFWDFCSDNPDAIIAIMFFLCLTFLAIFQK